VNEHNFRDYLSWSNEALYTRLADVTAELVSLHDEIAMAESQVLQEKSSAYTHSIAETDAARRREADAASVHIQDSVITMKGQRDALVEEKFFLIRLIERVG
jgi:hypothetical protein